MSTQDAYKPLRDYALVGNLRTAAVIGRDGSVDWCCFPHLDSESVFAAILDRRKGGRFKISLAGAGIGRQYYVKDTNVLVTEFASHRGKLIVTDFMPLSGNIDSLNGSAAPPELHRLLRFEGQGHVEVQWSPRFDYARSPTRMNRHGDGWLATDAGGRRLCLAGLPEGEITETETDNGHEVYAALEMSDGRERVVVTRWDSENVVSDLKESRRMLDETVKLWTAWAHQDEATRGEEWTGAMHGLVIRSELALKLLTHAETGAIAAAPTTSLPETIGGVRNWDYRYAWIRDASLTGQAMTSMGHPEAAVQLLDWIEHVTAAKFEQDWNLQIMYGIHGQDDLKEETLEHLEGYRQSRPVRIGNEAAEQFQLEIYGEVLTSAYELARRGIRFDEHVAGLLTKIANHVQDVWKEPDYGIWEIRGEPKHYTYSKIMAWVAMDRAIHLAERYGLPGSAQRWRRTRQEIRDAVLEHGYSESLGAFRMAFGRDELDAANLRIPLLEFLPCDDPRVQSTIDRTLEQLTERGLVYRYRIDDGLPGEEGAFGLCSFWLADTLAISGRIDEAIDIFEKTVRHANHVGLFPEQIDPATGDFLGNFPQAFTHIGLINSVLYLAYAQGRPVPETAPIGTPTHRETVRSEA
ncbi:MAG: glycoside hydrolase family 15 protein [Phycisphaerae bacterium]|nr:glycoside hydrolase family 15 protein [Phycisphaerae bacterium]